MDGLLLGQSRQFLTSGRRCMFILTITCLNGVICIGTGMLCARRESGLRSGSGLYE